MILPSAVGTYQITYIGIHAMHTAGNSFMRCAQSGIFAGFVDGTGLRLAHTDTCHASMILQDIMGHVLGVVVPFPFPVQHLQLCNGNTWCCAVRSHMDQQLIALCPRYGHEFTNKACCSASLILEYKQPRYACHCSEPQSVPRL